MTAEEPFRGIIRLANLISGLLDLVDVKKVPMIVGEKLSYLTREEQELVFGGSEKL